MVVFMYWSLEVPIWSLRPGWAKKWGWAAGIREESRQVALTKKKGTHFGFNRHQTSNENQI